MTGRLVDEVANEMLEEGDNSFGWDAFKDENEGAEWYLLYDGGALRQKAGINEDRSSRLALLHSIHR